LCPSKAKLQHSRRKQRTVEKNVCHDAGIVFTAKGDFIICVLIKPEGRFAKPAKRLISEIALLVYNHYNVDASSPLNDS